MKRLLMLLFILGWTAVAGANAVISWNDTATTAALAGAVNPLYESRIYAMMHVAIHDALNAIERRFQPYALDTQAAAGASPEAAVAAAAHDVLMALFPSGLATDLVGTAYVDALADIPDGPAEAQGIQIGQQAAAAILALRAGDGSDTPFVVDCDDYEPGVDPGDFQCIPGFDFVLAPGWGEVTPFVLTSSAQYRPKAPYTLTTKKYAADVNEVKRLGALNSTERTAEQSEIALFWVESSPQGWNRIARTVAVQRGTALWESARLFGLLNLASVDAYIADFYNKYVYEFWRPITAIRAADADGNPATSPDPAWESLQPTPPAPDHPSGHAGQGGAAAEVLTRFFGTDKISFSTTSTTLPGVTRSFTSFSQAAKENGNSRIYVGFHFRHAVTEGLKLGGKVGKVTVNHFLKPAH